MPVTLNAVGTQAGATTTTTVDFDGLTIAAGSDRVVLAVLVWRRDTTPGPIIEAEWDDLGTPQTMSPLVALTQVPGAVQWYAVYGLVAPTVGNLRMRFAWTNGMDEFQMNAIAFNGANQTGGTTTFPGASTNSGTGDPGTHSISLPSNGAVVSVCCNGSSAGLDSTPATQLMIFHGAGAIEAGASYSTSSGSFSYDFAASDTFGIGAVGIAEAAAGGRTTKNTRAFPLGIEIGMNFNSNI